jgi:hypothetical protein
MPTREIPRKEWVSFFDRFTGQHERWLARVELIGQDVGAQLEVKDLPLREISADLKDGEDVISITLGERPDQLVTHSIQAATHIRLKQTEEGADEALQIESADGTMTLLRFHSAVLPETLDGIVTD